jgi:uncharacterized membrane protein YuzA (DUF378 family)
MKGMHMVAFALTIIGGLNWGLVGLGWLVGGGANWNVVSGIASYIGGMPVEGIIYILVGLSALWLAIMHKKDCKWCSGAMGGSGASPMM